MEFGIEKWVRLMMKRRKIEKAKGIELPNHKAIRMFEEKKKPKYSEILEADIIK